LFVLAVGLANHLWGKFKAWTERYTTSKFPKSVCLKYF